MLTKPILFLIFNRLDTTQQVFEAIRQAKPTRLYIACDGARENKVGEVEKVQAVRDFVLSNIDWECEVKTLFQEKNLGCEIAVTQAINWFFDHEEDGIILEDDCLPDPTFFTYCETLLNYYIDNYQVMHIGGIKILDFNYGNASYYFGTVEHCWGWASWRRAWKHYDFSLEKYSLHILEEKLFNYYRTPKMQQYWKDIYLKVKNKKINSWAYRWTLSIIAYDGLCINPNMNLVSNIGFGGEGTHTFGNENPLANVPTHALEKTIHPSEIKRSMYIDEKIMNVHFGVYDNTNERVSLIEKKINRIKNIFKPIFFIYKVPKKIKGS